MKPILNSRLLSFLACVLISLPLAQLYPQKGAQAQETPDLFLSMKGKWTGKGTRHQIISGKTIQVTVHTESQLENQRLYSINEFVETSPSDGKTKNYLRNYWIEPNDSPENSYSLITSHDGVEKVTSHGVWDGKEFTVDQSIQWGPSVIHVHSVSRFETKPDGTPTCLYRDETSLDDRVTARSEIVYERLTP